MLDLADLLQRSIQLNTLINDRLDIHQPADAALKTFYVALDVELAEIANTSEWFKNWKTHHDKHDEGKTHEETLLTEYVDALDFFLLVAAKQTWSHLIVMDQDDIQNLADTDPAKDMNQQYLAIKRFLMNSFYERRQEDFRHAWRLFLKMGLVDFKFTQQQIQDTFVEKNDVNYERQRHNY